jgi:hypothetical protein
VTASLSSKSLLTRNYIHVKFTDTKGGTELGIKLDRGACDFSKADFDIATGAVHVEEELTLDYVRVRCIADIELKKS